MVLRINCYFKQVNGNFFCTILLVRDNQLQFLSNGMQWITILVDSKCLKLKNNEQNLEVNRAKYGKLIHQEKCKEFGGSQLKISMHT